MRTAPWFKGFLLTAAVLALGALNNELGGLGGDNAAYILLSKSLVTGQGYRSIWQPGAPLHIAYPFGFPLLLAPIVALLGAHAFLAMHLMVIAWSLTCLFLWVRWVRAETTPGIALASVGCTAATSLWLGSTQQILSEFPYLAFSLLSLLLARREMASSAKDPWRTRNDLALFAMGLCLLAAYFTRTVGMTLMVPVVGWLFWMSRRRADRLLAVRRCLWMSALLLLPILGWYARDVWVARGPVTHYTRVFLWADPTAWDRGSLSAATLWHRVAGNFFYYLARIGQELVWPTTQAASWAAPWVGGGLAVLMAVGFIIRLNRRSAAEGYLVCYAAVFLVWPYQEPRFLLPVLPWLWLYLLEGGSMLLRRFNRLRRLLLIGLLAGNLAGCAWGVGLNLIGFHYDPVFRGFLAAHDWLRSNTSPDAVVMSRKPTITALLSGRQVVWIPFADKPGEFLSILRGTEVNYVLDDGLFQETRRYLVPAIRRHLELFEPEMIRFGPTAVLKVKGKTQSP